MSDLKPCPFCGGEARLASNMTRSDNWVICRECNIYYPNDTRRKFTEAEAIAAWNSRAERTCQNIDDHKTAWFICSVCGYQQKLSHTRRYCPNCGARVVK